MRQCTACKEYKRPDEFRRRTICIDCLRLEVKKYNQTDVAKEKRRIRDRAHRSEAKRLRGQRRSNTYAQRHPDKVVAVRKLRSAIEDGILVRPSLCQRCGTPDNKRRDGRSMIHAHHHDYDKPLEVEWLCALCHSTEHRKTAELLRELEDK